MFHTSTRRVLLTGALLAIAFTGRPSANHQWGNYHWARQSNPFTLLAGNNLSGEWQLAYDKALADWSNSDVLDVTETAGRTKPKPCRPTSGRIEVCDANYGSNGWLGLAQIWASGDHITQGVAKMNDTYFSSPTYNTVSWRELVMCQEIAHNFGLDHQDETFDNPNLGSCMDYTSNPDGPPANTAPNKHDYDELDIIYNSHLDSTTTVGAARLPSSMPPAMGLIDFENPGQWGRLVRSNANGRVQVYELDFGGGNKVITHVFWADPDADARGRR